MKSLPAEVDIAALFPSWMLHLRSANKSPQTLTAYSAGVRGYLDWCRSAGEPPTLTKAKTEGYVVSLLDTSAVNTARIRLRALRLYADWLTAEGELDVNPIARLALPQQEVKVTHSLTDAQLTAFIKACQGKTFIDRRDEAIVRLFMETGMRAAEMIGLKVTDVDLARGLVLVHGKGRKDRIAPFSSKTGTAIDSYVRRRNRLMSPHAALWLNGRAGAAPLTYSGLRGVLTDRANAAGIDGFHLHLMRHTAATRWLRAGGSEQGLMAVAGWKTREMLDRYTTASASERAADEARGLNLGEL